MWKLTICVKTNRKETRNFNVNITDFYVQTLEKRFLWTCICNGKYLPILYSRLNQYFSVLDKFKDIKNITNCWSFNKRSSILILTKSDILRSFHARRYLKENQLNNIRKIFMKFGPDWFVLIRIIITFNLKDLMVQNLSQSINLCWMHDSFFFVICLNFRLNPQFLLWKFLNCFLVFTNKRLIKKRRNLMGYLVQRGLK